MKQPIFFAEGLMPDDVYAPRQRPYLFLIWEKLKHGIWGLYQNKMAFLGAIMLVVLLVTCSAAPLIDRYHPIKQNYRALLQPPNSAHYFGTDRYGRDIWSRVLWGGRRLLIISFFSVITGLMVGVPFGVLAGYYGGWVDTISMRIADAWLAFPGVLLFLLLATVAREWELEGMWSDITLILGLGIAYMPQIARLVRSTVLTEKEKEYVEACRIIGESHLCTAMRQILPNCLSPLIVQSTIRVGNVILIIAALSFLGLGSPPPTPDWGADLNLARDHLETAPRLALFPGLAIAYAVLAFNLFGDGLRDIFDPRLVGRS